MIAFEEFQRVLRANLNHLFDPDFLRKSPLAGWLGIAGRYDTPTALHKILADEIEQLRPADSAAHGGIDQQVYDILLFRYLQQSDPEEVAHQLGVSERQLRRVQANALETLAYRLWKRFKLEDRLVDTLAADAQDTDEVEPSPATAGGKEDAPGQNDFDWLSTAQVINPLDVSEELKKILALIHPMAIQYRVTLNTNISEGLPHVAVHPVAFRQVLLGILGEVFKRFAGQKIQVGAVACPGEVELSISFERPPQEVALEEAQGIQDARHIVELSRGRLKVSATGGMVELKLDYPIMPSYRVLVVDDNQDLIDLMTRYVDGTHFHIIGLSKPGQAIDVALSEGAQLILLDVMMSDADGWEVLGRLRSHPQTGAIPIVICTILSQEELARVLGAAAFIQKPVRREVLLEVLESLTQKLEPGSK